MKRSVGNNIARETRRTVAAIRQNAYELSNIYYMVPFLLEI